jgi:hypothetical protein
VGAELVEVIHAGLANCVANPVLFPVYRVGERLPFEHADATHLGSNSLIIANTDWYIHRSIRGRFSYKHSRASAAH